MPDAYCGIDFGTTNSSAAIITDEGIRVLELDKDNDNPESLPSLLYISREGERIVGRKAATTFIERNVDREVVVKQVDLGIHIHGYVGGEGDNEYGSAPRKDGSEHMEAVRARAIVEVNSPGRLFQSIKTSLRLREFRGTEVFGRPYQIEELTSLIIRHIKDSLDEAAGGPVRTAVFGRPVRFSKHEEEDRVAERRLETAARLAGFRDVVFFYEPVAACVEYAVQTDRRQRLMVVDIGGGTFDVCIMEFGKAADPAARLAESRILGIAGLPVAGDAIDREITRAKVFPLLGSKSRYGPSVLPVPQYVYNSLLEWQNMYKMNTEETINWLIAMEMSSDQPERIRALRSLILRNYGYPLAREVEAAKKRLSFEEVTSIAISNHDLNLAERIERSECAHIIEDQLADMLATMIEAERTAGIKPADLDFVLTTGGTSLVPAIRQMLVDRYGAEKLHQRDTFTSVATGLAVVARYL